MRETRRVKYRADSSMLHSLHPVVKLVCFALSAATVLCASDALALAVTVAFTAAVVYLSQIDKKDVVSAIKNAAFLPVLIFLMNTCFSYPEYAFFRWYIFAPSLFGAIKGLFLAVRFLLIVLLCDVLSNTTPTAEMTDAFAFLLYPLSLAGIPTAQAAFILASALDFIPFILSETERIRFAQKARGRTGESGNLISETENALRSLLPVLASAFNRTERLSLSMEVRGGSAEKSFVPDFKPDKNDVYALLVCFAVFFMRFVIL